VPANLFRHANVAGADLACMALIAGASSTFVLLPLFLQRVFGFTAAASGLAMLPYSAAVIAGGQFAGMAMARFSLRRCIAGGIGLFTAGVVALAFAHHTHAAYAVVVLPAMLAAAFGATVASLAVMACATGGVPARDQGLASAVLMTCQQIGVAIGVSVVFALMAGAQSPETAFRTAFLAAAAFALAAAVSIYGLTAKTTP
jgi:predicted MFS family arabinose efflux permease